MRILTPAILATFAFTSLVSLPAAKAQDPGMDPAQQAMQASVQAMQNAQQQAQLAQQQNQQISDQMNQQMMQNAQDSSQSVPFCCFAILKPTFSVKPGSYSAPLRLKIHDATRGAIIYYTTDGWTPTDTSPRYIGPITIDSTTTLRAVAITPDPYFSRSAVAIAEYTLPASAPKPNEPAPIPSGSPEAARKDPNAPAIPPGSILLPQGMPVHLVFATEVSSKTADVGDKIELRLAQDIKSGDEVLVKKGALAQGIVTEVEHTAAGGAPGDISFEVHSLDANGTRILLWGTATKEGEAKLPSAAALIPFVGPLSFLVHGKEAQIQAGTPMTAYVDADTVMTQVTQPQPPKSSTRSSECSMLETRSTARTTFLQRSVNTCQYKASAAAPIPVSRPAAN